MGTTQRDGYKQVNFYLPTPLWERFDKYVTKHKISKADVVRDLLKDFFKAQRKAKEKADG